MLNGCLEYAVNCSIYDESMETISGTIGAYLPPGDTSSLGGYFGASEGMASHDSLLGEVGTLPLTSRNRKTVKSTFVPHNQSRFLGLWVL